MSSGDVELGATAKQSGDIETGDAKVAEAVPAARAAAADGEVGTGQLERQHRMDSVLSLLHDEQRTLQEMEHWDAHRLQRFVEAFDVSMMDKFLARGVDADYFEKGVTVTFEKLYLKRGDKVLVHNVSGVMERGSLTAVVGGAENGTQAFLEVLGGVSKGDSTGVISVDGSRTSRSFRRQVGFVPAEDIHLPNLTVREALLFSARQRLPQSMPDVLKRLKVEVVMKMLGLSHAADTLTGNSELRGISGGEKRRLSIGVELVAGHSVLVLDRPTNGLDSAAAYDFTNFCRVACGSGASIIMSLVQPSPELLRLFDNVMVMSRGRLIYFGPLEDAEPFFLAQGFVRPRHKSVADFLQEIALFPERFHRPRAALRRLREDPELLQVEGQAARGDGVEAKPGAGAGGGGGGGEGGAEASQRARARQRDMSRRLASLRSPTKAQRSKSGRHTFPTPRERPHPMEPFVAPEGTLEALEVMPKSRSTRDAVLRLVHALTTSARWERLGLQLWEMDAQPLFPSEDRHHRKFNTSMGSQIKECVRRELTITARNRPLQISICIRSLFVGLIAGSLFFDIGTGQDDVRSRAGAAFFVVITQAFSQLQLVPELFNARRVYYHQRRTGWFHGLAYYISFFASALPISLLETLSFSVVFYAMAGFQDNVIISGSFWLFYCSLMLVSLTAKSVALLISSFTPAEQVAQVVVPVFFVFNFLFAGFLNPKGSIPAGWSWMYYVSFFTFPIRAVAVNEYIGLTFACDNPLSNPATGQPFTDINNQTVCAVSTGNDALALYDMDLSDPGEVDTFKWQLWAVEFIYLVAYNVIAAYLVINTDFSKEPMVDFIDDMAADHYEMDADVAEEGAEGEGAEAKGASDKRDVRSESAVSDDGRRVDSSEEPGRTMSKSLASPDASVSVTFDGLNYFVPVKGGEKQLLQDVYGFARQGMLIALMGPSGAGKSTLLDVLAGRKNVGRVEGTLHFNGRPRDAGFNRVAGYVEQIDSHEPFTTVREAIEFSAMTRLPAAMPHEEKMRRVEEVIETLGLQRYAERMIGMSGEGGVAPEIRKKITIAVELVIRPAVLFLDEPTTGLDSISASRIVRTIKRLSRRICVICTIHQPSAELFSYFDWMLLLAKGGRMAYFGETSGLREYFVSQGLGEPDEEANLADFALQVTGAGIGGSEEQQRKLLARVTDAYRASPQHGSMTQAVQREREGNQRPLVDAIEPGIGLWDQFKVALGREMLVQKRDKQLRGAVVGSSLWMSFISSTLFWQMSNDQTGATNRISVIFVAITFVTFSASAVIPLRIGRRDIYFRERTSGMYNAFVYFLARTLAEIPLRTLQTVIFSTIVYWLTGMNDSDGGARFFIFMLGLWFAVLNGVAFAELVATIGPNGIAASLMHTVFLVSNLLTSGFLSPKAAIPSFWLWLYQVNIFRFPIFFLSTNELDGLDFGCPGNNGAIQLPLGCASDPSVSCTSSVCPITSGEDVMNQFSMSSNDLWTYFMGLVLFQIVMRLISAFGFRYLNFVRR